MTDKTMDVELQIAELEMQITQQMLNVRAANVRRRKLLVELNQVDANTEAAEKQIAELESRLEKLTK